MSPVELNPTARYCDHCDSFQNTYSELRGKALIPSGKRVCKKCHWTIKEARKQ